MAFDRRRTFDRVLHVMNGAAGGAALSTMSLMRALKACGVKSAAVAADVGTAQEKAAVLDACEGRAQFQPLYAWNRKTRAAPWRRPLIEARQLARTGFGVCSALRAADHAHRFGADLVHSNTLLTLEGAAVAQHLGLPHVWHVRELVGRDAPFRFALQGRALGEYLSAHASMIVANSEESARRVAPGCDRDRLCVVENGIDITRFRRRTRRTGARLVTAMVANPTSRWKKHGLFIDAARIAAGTVDVEWRIYGHAPAEDRYVQMLCHQVKDAGLDPRFRFMGHVDDPVAIMNEIDLLVHPADGESFGRVVVEAWAAGVPVVGVAGGGVGRLITHEKNGLLAPIDDAAALARAIVRACSSPALRDALASAGRASAERYSIESYAENMLRVYQRSMRAPLGHRRATRLWRSAS